MSSDIDRAELQLAHHKVSVVVELHPVDEESARFAAKWLGLAYNDFCTVAIHRAVLGVRNI